MSLYWISGLVAVGILTFILVATEAGRFAKTIFLIARVTPYEQVGTGTGRILLVGDSTGYGTGATRGADSIAGLIGAEYSEFQIENRSKNGDTIGDALARVTDIEGQYDLIVVQLGGNDIIQERDLAQTLEDLNQLYERLQLHTRHLVMLSAGNVGAAFAFSGAKATALTAYSRTYHTALENFADSRPNFTYVNLFDEPADDPFVSEPKVYLAMDGLHPTSAGYALWYQKLASVVQSRFEQSAVMELGM